MKVSNIYLLCFCLAPTSICSMRLPAHNWAHTALLAQDLAYDLLRTNSDKGKTRNLAALSDWAFERYVCDPHTDAMRMDVPGISCTCSASDHSHICKTRYECYDDEEVPECDTEVCGSATFTTRFHITNDYSIIVSSVSVVEDVSGADYSGMRVEMYAKDNNENDVRCEQYFSIDNVEYMCNSCNLCSVSEETVSLDCTNILPGATTDGCMSIEVEAYLSPPLFPMCVEGGAPLPTTEPNSRATSHLPLFGFVAASIGCGILSFF